MGRGRMKSRKKGHLRRAKHKKEGGKKGINYNQLWLYLTRGFSTLDRKGRRKKK